jgi:hypothetical protein
MGELWEAEAEEKTLQIIFAEQTPFSPGQIERETALAWEIYNMQDDYDWTCEYDIGDEESRMWEEHENQAGDK